MQPRIYKGVLLIEPDQICKKKKYPTVLDDPISWWPLGKHALMQVDDWFFVSQLPGCQWVNHWGCIYVHDYLISETGMPETLQTIKVILLKMLQKKKPIDVYQYRSAWGQGSCRGEVRNRQWRKRRGTCVELFPYPEVTAKYGQGARNRYFPALYGDCAISHLGWGALKKKQKKNYWISSPRELFLPWANCCQRAGSKSAALRCGSQREADHVSICRYCFLSRVYGSTEEEEGSEKTCE